MLVRYYDLIIEDRRVLSFAASAGESPEHRAADCYMRAFRETLPPNFRLICTAGKNLTPAPFPK